LRLTPYSDLRSASGERGRAGGEVGFPDSDQLDVAAGRGGERLEVGRVARENPVTVVGKEDHSGVQEIIAASCREQHPDFRLTSSSIGWTSTPTRRRARIAGDRGRKSTVAESTVTLGNCHGANAGRAVPDLGDFFAGPRGRLHEPVR
jgi:hypothetical protein